METVGGVCTAVKKTSKLGLGFHKFLTALRREFKKQGFDLKIRSVKDKTLGENVFFVNAYYDPEDDENADTAIEVVVHHNFDKESIWTQKDVSDFLVQIFDAVVHEFKHQRQSRKRHHRQYWEHVDIEDDYRLYLADPDEVDAYALSIAVELCRNLGKFRALRYMGKFSKLAKLKTNECFVSSNLSAYLGQFESTDPVIRKLIKKVYIRLQKIDTDCIFV